MSEVIDENRQDGGPRVFSADYRRSVSAAVRRAMDHANTPMDGGWGFETVPPAVADAASKIVGVTYAGEIPTPPVKIPEGFKPFPTLP